MGGPSGVGNPYGGRTDDEEEEEEEEESCAVHDCSWWVRVMSKIAVVHCAKLEVRCRECDELNEALHRRSRVCL